jgi:CRISPR/Cas system-associated exonuclease Cas4 (RecB family)
MDFNMIDAKEFLLQVLRTKEKNRSRSKQSEVGPSELGGCRRKVWYRLNNRKSTNPNELKLAAIMGTAIHSEIEKAIKDLDPDNKKYLIETEVEFNGMKAHIDLFIPETGDVIDWKTVKVKNLSYFPTQQQRWQVQVYGYLIEKSGKGFPKTVNLVAIARDGDERDVIVHSEPYDPKIAEEALNWLAAIKESAVAPEPERDQSYCRHYCKYFDESGKVGCTGLKKELIKQNEVFIDDPEVDTSALKYLQLDEKIKELSNERDSLRTALEGFTGQTNSGINIIWTTISGRSQVDAEEVQKLLGFVPTKQGQESVRLSVKQTGGK